MFPVSGHPVRFAVCPHCLGEWVDRNKLDSSAEAAASHAVPQAGRLRPVPDLTAAEMEIKYLHCPVCADRMNRRQFAPGSGVIVDECRDHGVWLDAGEQERILKFARTHGLPRKISKTNLQPPAMLLSSACPFSERTQPEKTGWDAVTNIFDAGDVIGGLVEIAEIVFTIF